MLAMENDLEQAGVFGTDRTQRPIVSSGFFKPLADTVQQSIRRCLQADDRERIQVAGVGRAAQFCSSPQISNTFAHRQPLHDLLATGQTQPAYFESSRVINGGL